MKYIENKLGRQLLLILIITFDIILITVVFFLPKIVNPIYEAVIYDSLKGPIDMIEEDIGDNNINRDVAYVYIHDNKIFRSKNYDAIIDVKKEDLLPNITKEFGSFKFNDKLYYYYSIIENGGQRVAVANESYLANIKNELMISIITIFLISFAIVAIIIFVWSSIVVRKIEKIKNKIDNIDNDNYNHNLSFKSDDEIQVLASSIEDMRISLKEQEEYKNNMYQNISHDFKTPLTVIKSYVEAVEDGVEDKDKALSVIKEQTDKLEKKVYSLLYLNKLEYLKETNKTTYSDIDIKAVINSSVDKFKYQRQDVKITTNIDNSKFTGTDELWETIIDNILNNFIRYADKEIKITVKKHVITLYNDGPNIDEQLKDDLFNPFKKGIKGQFGLGLSIVKKTLNLLTYDIHIENNKKGISFIIKKLNKSK
jgi:two-component system sensor histidine kinase CssS